MEKLDCNAFMIGDWVSPFRLPDIKVQVRPEDYINLSEYEPIPLTSKILEKNGFTTLEEDSYIYKKLNENGDDVDFRITIDMLVPWLSHIEKNSRPKASYSGKIEHVHKLQQILRLLGIEKDIVV